MEFNEQDIEAIADRRTARAESKKINYAIYSGMALVLAGWFAQSYSQSAGYIAMGLGVLVVFYFLYYYLPSKQKAARWALLQEWRKGK